MKEIKINDFLKERIEHEDVILLKEYIYENLHENVVIDFQDRKDIPIDIFSSVLMEIRCEKGCDYVSRHLSIKNLPNADEFYIVLNGTSYN